MMTTRISPKTASSKTPKVPRSERKVSSRLIPSVPQRLPMPPTATMAMYLTDFMVEASEGPMPPL